MSATYDPAEVLANVRQTLDSFIDDRLKVKVLRIYLDSLEDETQHSEDDVGRLRAKMLNVYRQCTEANQ